MSNSGGIKSFHPRELPHSSDEKLNIQATGLMTRPSYLRRFSKKQNNFRFYIYCKEFLVLFLGSCSSTQPRSRGGLLEYGFFDKHYVYGIQKKGPAGKTFGIFSPRYSQNCILNRNLNHKMHTNRVLFCKFRAIFFYFQMISPISPLVAGLLFYFFQLISEFFFAIQAVFSALNLN